jgi:Mrp family chromosome partitioning ATPase
MGMGKILATLGQNGSVANPPVSSDVPPPPPEDLLPDGEEMPFIEIGPKRQVEGSPDVLAMPLPHPGKPAGAVLLGPHSVQFRNLSQPAGPELAAELVAYHAPHQPAARQYAELLGSLLHSARKKSGKSQALLFTAVRAESGATTVLLNVAITAAQQGNKVVVVDGNLRRPGVARKLGLPDAPGLAELLAGECPADEPLRETAVEGLVALTAGAPAPVLVDVGALHALVEQLREAFDLVLVDGPRWDGRSGCLALAQACDAVFLVAVAAEADSPPASELMRQMPGEGIALAGCVLTNP